MEPTHDEEDGDGRSLPPAITESRRSIKSAVCIAFSEALDGKDGGGMGRLAGTKLHKATRQLPLDNVRRLKESGKFEAFQEADYAPFNSAEDYKLVKWLLKSKTSKGSVSDLLQD